MDQSTVNSETMSESPVQPLVPLRRPVFHPLALIFPEIEGEAFDSLVASIREHGQREPVLLADGKIADGRNRARAIWKLQDEGLEIELNTVVWESTTGRSLAEEVWLRNAVRRQLTSDQKAMAVLIYQDAVAEECARRQAASRFGTTSVGEPDSPVDPIRDLPLVAPESSDKNARSQRGQLAALANLSRHKIDKAMRIKNGESPQLFEAVHKGDVTLAKACRQLATKDDCQAEPAGTPVKESPSIADLARRAWRKLKDQVGCADASDLRAAMRTVIQEDEDAHGGGRKKVGTLPAVEKKRGRGRPPKNLEMDTSAGDQHGGQDFAA